MGIKENDLKRITDIVTQIAQKFGVERVTLFGSVARGDNDENSDYDFLISSGGIHSLFQYVDFVETLEETLKTHVDVITESSTDEFLVETAKKGGILIYEREHEGYSIPNNTVP